MAEPGDRTPEQDDAARIADTRRAMELGLPPARGTTAPGHGRGADESQRYDGVRSLDDHRDLQAGPAGVAGAGGGGAGGGAAAAGAAPSAAAAGPPSEIVVKKAKEMVEKVQAAVDAHTVEEIWKTSQPSPQGAAPEHHHRPGQGRPPNQRTDRGPGNRGPSR
ncbi:hypothetical protein [Kribbella lupini]|uniref:Uncharacterized protein n=1 Tax=Kribbella lupini TaxID=291602 RepID=A0ABP4L8N7_9ACTN